MNKNTIETIWDSTRYHAFYHSDINQINLIADCISDQAKGHSLGKILLCVVDSFSRFCDLELKLENQFQTDSIIEPPSAPAISTPLSIALDKNSTVEFYFNTQTGILNIIFDSLSCNRWLQLRNSPVWLGLHQERLAAIICTDVIDDPTGSHELAWLDNAETIR